MTAARRADRHRRADAACEAGRHHLCRGTIVSLTVAHGAPFGCAATCGDLSLVGLGQQATPMRVNVLARDESIAFLGKRTRIDNQAALSWRSCWRPAAGVGGGGRLPRGDRRAFG